MKNILFITADQLAYTKCGYGGDEKAITPNIDALASQSVDFYNCVASHPVCAAFRATLFTGKYTTSTGMVINEVRLNPAHHPHPLAKVLGANNVDGELIGKWHLWANHLGDFENPENSFVPKGEYRFGFDGYFAHCNMRHKYYDAFYHLDGKEKIMIKDYEPDIQTDMAIERLKLAKESGKNLALFVQYGTPHNPWEEYNCTKESLAKFDGVEFDVSPNYIDADDVHGDEWSKWLKTPEEIKRLKRYYYAQTNNLDTNVGRLMQALKDLGLEDDTIVVFTSDHGEMFGSHGRRNKNIFYDEAAKIPFLVRVPSVEPKKLDSPISNVDFMPTLLDLLDIEIPSECEGQSIKGKILGKEDAIEPEFAFLQNTGPCAIWGDGNEWRAVRDKQYTYAIFKSDGEEHLYDNINDPYQMKNLIGEKKFARVEKRLKTQMESKMKEINDNFDNASYYKENWIDDDRIIIKTATSK